MNEGERAFPPLYSATRVDARHTAGVPRVPFGVRIRRFETGERRMLEGIGGGLLAGPVTQGDNGTLTAIPSGPVDSVSWQRDGVPLPWTTLVLTSMPVGEYAVAVTAGEGTATATAKVSFSAVRPLSVVAITKDASSYDTKDGSVKLYISDGVPPYSAQWSHGPTATYVLLRAGDYSVTVTDHSGASAVGTYHISQPTSFDIDDRLLEVNLMGDTTCRDLYCRTVEGRGAVCADEGVGALQMKRGYGEGAEGVASLVASPDGTGGAAKMLVSACSAGGISHPVLPLDSTGDVHVTGDLTIVGQHSVVTVPALEVNQRALSVSDLDPLQEDAGGGGVAFGSQGQHGIAFGWDCRGWEVQGDLVSRGLRFSDAASLTAGALSVRKWGCAITLNDDGLVLEGARVVDEVPTALHYLSTSGAQHVASGAYLGADDEGWRACPDSGFSATSFDAGDSSLAAAGLTCGPGVELTQTGVAVGGGVSASAQGLDLGASGTCVFGDLWRLRVSADDGSLQFERSEDGQYETKLAIQRIF
ncbi:hypothetical protein JKP88DRAFT_272816 [Tribonema minus]|uniref:Uncharacterized protein n=1 Tax=Tribonema minus TaxID=303371 RepID=A0A836CEI9_9STRA|nr:hypothetical protein JKP88DRAFT_272816 [Tribonema minus]